MNVLDNKKKSISQQELQTSLKRHLDMVSQIKPSLDAFSQINKTDLEKPFLEMNNLNLDIKNSGNMISNQIQNLKHSAFNSNNTAQIVSMKYQNNNGNISGSIHKLNANSPDGKNYQVKEEVVDLPSKETVITSFSLNLDNNEGVWTNNNLKKKLSSNTHNKKLISNKNKEEVYNGVVSVDKKIYVPEDKSNMERAFSDMMGKMRTNKIMILVFIFAIILVAVFLRK